MIEQFIKGNVDLVKQLNMATIYQTIAYDGPISRTRICEATSIAGASVSKITKQLLKAGLIKELCQEKSTGGRRAVLLSTAKENFYVISLNLGRGYLRAAFMSLAGKTIKEKFLNITGFDQEEVLKQTFSEIESMMASVDIRPHRILGIGLIMPGLVNPVDGILIETPHFHFRNLNIVRLFEERFDVPTYLDNDIRSLALAEHYFGAAKNVSDSVFIRVKHGIGAGIIVGGNIFYGTNQNAGEIGHMFIDNLGPRCNCGNFGCLETLAANPSILRYARELMKEGHPSALLTINNGEMSRLSVNDICLLANSGDELSQAILKRVGHYLGIAIATVVNLFNPNMIILSGDIIQAPDYIFPSIHQQMNEKSLKTFAERIKIVPSQLVNSDSIGGFALIQRALLKGRLFSRIVEDY